MLAEGVRSNREGGSRGGLYSQLGNQLLLLRHWHIPQLIEQQGFQCANWRS